MVITRDDLENTFIKENVIYLLERELGYIEDGDKEYDSYNDLYDIADDIRKDGYMTLWTQELEAKFNEDFNLDEILDFAMYFKEEYGNRTNISMHKLEIMLTEEYLSLVLSDNNIHEMDDLEGILTTEEQIEYMIYKSLDSLDSLDEKYEARYNKLLDKLDDSKKFAIYP